MDVSASQPVGQTTASRNTHVTYIHPTHNNTPPPPKHPTNHPRNYKYLRERAHGVDLRHVRDHFGRLPLRGLLRAQEAMREGSRGLGGPDWVWFY